MMAALYGDEATRFLHATHVYLYILATSPTFHSPAHTPSPNRSAIREGPEAVNVIPATPDASREAFGAVEDRSSPARSQYARLSLSLPTRARKLSMVRRIISHLPPRITPSSPPLATTSDYRNIASVLITIHKQLPVRGLLTGVPFLIALSSVMHVDGTADSASLERIRVMREVISEVWLAVGETWDCGELVEMAKKALSSMPASSYSQREEARTPGKLADFQVPAHISPVNDAGSVWSGVVSQAALDALVSSQNALEATGMDRESLHKRLSIPWTAESAFRDSMEPQSNYDPLRHDGLSPHLRLAPSLMHIENLSLQSLSRPTRGVGVTDLREALEGRGSMSNPALANRAPSLSTLDHASTHVDTAMSKLRPVRSRPEKPRAGGGSGEVRDMLSKLHIGKSGNNSNLLRASFPGLQRQEARKTPNVVPPYKS